MLIARVGHALTCLAALVVLAGAAAAGPSVTVSDGALAPPSVAVQAGGSVLWTNQGSRQHEIAAAGGAFPSFSLVPGGTRSVAFMKPGRFPYLLDGEIKGTVFVTASSSGAGGQPQAVGGCRNPAIYRYDVRIVVHRESTTPSTLGGAVKTTSDWKASWVAAMSVERCDGVTMQIDARTAAMGGNMGGPPIDLHGGQFDRTYDWNDTTREIGVGGDVPTCHYTDTSNAPAVMHLTARDIGGQSSLDFLAGADRNLAFDDAAALHRACAPERVTGHKEPYQTKPIDGIRATITDDKVVLYFATPPSSPVETNILDALAAGKGFNFDTGMQFIEAGNGVVARARATVSFSPLEN